MGKPRVVLVVGTRPDAIKSAPVALALLRRSDACETLLVSTGQHREMLDQALGAFGLTPDRDLEIMRPGQSLAALSCAALEGLDRALAEMEPDYVMAQGDTTTTFIASLAAFYRRIPFGHIEAGLRTRDLLNPFPEEFNRRAAAIVASQHFAPTRWAKENLLAEGHDPARVLVTGNTGIDAVLMVAEREPQDWFPEHRGRVLLVTTHRRENWGEPQAAIARAVRRLAETHGDLLVAVAMHRNPIVRETIVPILRDAPRTVLMEPPEYAKFVKLMQRSSLILTDSGGVQEEAPAFGVPVLVLRETTERPEGVQAGTAKLVGTDERRVFEEASRLLDDPAAYAAMAQAVSPYGDGRASERTANAVLRFLGCDAPEVNEWEH
ncbi:MAG: UDP-N-acetylglucosamine 2-epimerase (non-hydrolyzing) [Fimbriimonadales bacterium]|nr:UDP-N-acetylglucosamine 2-epimerase (non-hydrolyzing) [Fimbriimonadales bacterium]